MTSPVLQGHENLISLMALTPDDTALLTGSADKTIRIWDLDSDNPIDSSVILKGQTWGANNIAISSDSHLAVTTSSDGTIRVWCLDIRALLKQAKMIAGRRLRDSDRRLYRLD